jgi:dolichol-phosphate mannosyltransferase
MFAKAIVIPSYGEEFTLPLLLKSLSSSIDQDTVIIVADDSTSEVRSRLVPACEDKMINSLGTLMFSFSEDKLGRGAAVRRGMKLARNEFPNLVFIVECDADGSHRSEDITLLLDNPIDCDLLVGSRYLKDSEIIGWPIRRRVFSKILNKLIPFMLQLHLKDVTNGLRRYSMKAVDTLLDRDATTFGFIYLSEQALLISNRGLTIEEIPIVFKDRVLGSSTVTWTEILGSLFGIIQLLFLHFKLKSVKN